MKSFYFLVLVVIFSFLLSLNNFKLFDIEETSLFLTVIGLIYGLIAAFTISNAWERFGNIRDAIAEETYALTSAYIYGKQLSDQQAFKELKKALTIYCQEVPNVEWKNYWASEKTHQKFRNIIEIVARIKFKVEKDSNLFDEITTDLEDAARSRNQQLVISQIRIPRLQWILNIFLSLILVIGLMLASIPNQILSIFITGSMIASILMILFVIRDLDSMKMAEEEVSTAPYQQLIDLIKREEKIQAKKKK